MALGIINHLMLTVKNVNQSCEFYNPIMKFLGYELYARDDYFALWRLSSGIGDFIITQAAPELSDVSPQRFAPGFHHVAFNANSRLEVDRLYELLVQSEVKVLDPPCECEEYSPGYYAVYFEDPDGMKLELAHTPNQRPKGSSRA